jgi:inositol phosphorylceramide mannosyltransferase catalytic subunit
MAGIPHIVHQIYFGGEEAVRADYRIYRATWQRHHRGWSHQFWDAASCRKLIAESYPWFLEYYDAYSHRIQQCDAIRYFILDAHGGLYVDMDIESLKPVDSLIEDCDLLLSENAGGYTNAIVGSTPGHPLWPPVFDEMVRRRHRPPWSFARLGRQSFAYDVCRSTGPLLLDDCVRSGNFHLASTTRVCPGYVFEPLAPRIENGRMIQSNDTERAYAIHHMSLHWLPPFQRLTSALFQPVAALYWAIRRRGSRA